MKELDIKVGYACNNNCLFCLNKNKRAYQEFPVENLKSQISAAAQKGCQKLIISGGEPLISRNFFELLAWAKQNKIKTIEVQTNGRMLCYDEFIEQLKLFQPIQFLVSLHFPNARLYQKYCQSEGFEQTVQGLKNLVKHNCLFTVNTVIMKPNLSYLKKLVSFLKRIGVKRMQYRFIDGKNVLDQYEKFVSRFKECLPIIRQIIKENPTINLTLNEIPLCVLGKSFKQKLSPLDPKRINLAMGNKLFESKDIWQQQFVFPLAECKKCLYHHTCRGVRKEYDQIYGNKEFKALAK